jgi:hypothetical protein
MPETGHFIGTPNTAQQAGSRLPQDDVTEIAAARPADRDYVSAHVRLAARLCQAARLERRGGPGSTCGARYLRLRCGGHQAPRRHPGRLPQLAHLLDFRDDASELGLPFAASALLGKFLEPLEESLASSGGWSSTTPSAGKLGIKGE